MRAACLSLLYAAIWLTSTASALVARNPVLRARADTTTEYPRGYDAKTCPSDRTSITLRASPAPPEAVALPGAALAASRLSEGKRALSPQDLSQVCRQVAHFPFTGADYYAPPPSVRRVLTLATSLIQPGLYVASVKANMLIRGLEIDDKPSTPWQHGNIARVENDLADRMGVRFRIVTPVHLKITIRYWVAGTAGEFGLFKIGPSGYNGPSP